MKNIPSQKEITDALRREYGQMPPSVRYITILIAVFVFYLYADNRFSFKLFDVLTINNFIASLRELNTAQTIFLIINLITILLFAILLLKRFWIWTKKLYYKYKYPLKKFGDTYLLVISGGNKVYLLDYVKREILWIKSWETALDLNFINQWVHITINGKEFDFIKYFIAGKISENLFIETEQGFKKELKKFKYNPSGIHTRSTPEIYL